MIKREQCFVELGVMLWLRSRKRFLTTAASASIRLYERDRPEDSPTRAQNRHRIDAVMVFEIAILDGLANP